MSSKDMSQEPIAVPGYGETIAEIGRHLGERKGLLLKRTILIAWPAILFATAATLGKELVDNGVLKLTEDSPYVLPLMIGGGVWLLFAIVYYAVLNYIFTIEKRIWIDSFFDKRVMEPKASWRAARRLFFPALIVSMNVFVRYILPGILVLIGFIWAAVFFATMDNANEATVIIIPLAGLAIVMLYFYLLKVKLRFLPFIFLDRYGAADFTYGGLFREMKQLNTIEKTALKAFVYSVGQSSLNSLASTIANQLEGVMGNFGPVGRVLGTLVGTTAKEAANQALSYGHIIATYMLYRYARSQAYPEAQLVNERVYELSK